MEFIQKKFVMLLESWRESELLSVIYALAAEALFIGYFYFIGFFTIETLLPTFVTVRFSLTKFFFVLIVMTMLLALLGRFLKVTFPWNITKKSPLLWLGILWGISILAISLIKFPFIFIPIIIALFAIAGYLFWSISIEEK